MNEVKITIPDNCELVKEGNTYVIKEKDSKPKSWKEFRKNFPIKPGECFIDTDSRIIEYVAAERREIEDRNFCVNQEEAEAFLALMQLRQLRKVWVGDWEQTPSDTETAAISCDVDKQRLTIPYGYFLVSNILSFPSLEMAQEFLECFRDLCETAKTLL